MDGSQLLDPTTGKPFSRNGATNYRNIPFQGGYSDQGLDDGYGTFAVPQPITFSAILSGSDRTEWQNRWDEAYRHSREDALVMRRDAFLMGLLQERKLAVASIPWELEIPDEKDAEQVLVRDTLKRAVENIADLRRILYALLEAVWYGRYGVQLEWTWTRIQGKRIMTVADWLPVNGDKLGWNWDGEPYVLVNAGVAVPRKDTKIVNTTAGGRGLLLRGTWRDRFIIHRHEMDDGDFFEPEMQAAIHGVGLRSRVFWMDWIRREYLEWITTFLERVGLGVTLWYYDGGNPAALASVQTAARNQSRRANLFVPVFTDGKGSPKGLVERIETPVNGVDALRMLKEDIEQKIERYFVGQEASSKGEGASGLGNQASAKFQWQCVPVEGSEILTRDGWKKPREVAICEEVLAYDHESDQSVWTPLLSKTFYHEAPVVRLYNERGRFEALCTDNHSWAVEKPVFLSQSRKGNSKDRELITGLRGAERFADPTRCLMPANRILSNNNIILAAPEQSTESLLTPTEAAILGWAVTDGSFHENRNGVITIRICQSKEKHFPAIRSLVESVAPGYAESVSKPTVRTFPTGKTYACKPQHNWALPVSASQDLLQKCQYRSRDDLARIITRLSFEARQAMLDAMMQAESDSQFSRMTNTDQRIIDAFEILCALQGIATGPAKVHETTHSPVIRKVMKKVRVAYGAFLKLEDCGDSEVWCPTTQYGTWVMRQNGRVCVTGNTKELITRWDAANLGETLTGNERNPGLIYLMQRYSFPGTLHKFRVKFSFGVEKQEAEKKLNAIEKLIGWGIKVKADEARQAAGLSKPDPGDEVIDTSMMQQQGMGAPGQAGEPQPGSPPPAQGGGLGEQGFQPPYNKQEGIDDVLGEGAAQALQFYKRRAEGKVTPVIFQAVSGPTPGYEPSGPVQFHEDATPAKGEKDPKNVEMPEIDEELWRECRNVIPEFRPDRLPHLCGIIDKDIQVYLVDGNEVKIKYESDFVESAQGEEADYIPSKEIWLDCRE